MEIAHDPVNRDVNRDFAPRQPDARGESLPSFLSDNGKVIIVAKADGDAFFILTRSSQGAETLSSIPRKAFVSGLTEMPWDEIVVEPDGGEYRFKALLSADALCTEWDVAKAILPSPLLKSEIPPGARWITVHPHGPGTKGQPVLVQEERKGSGIWRVIGGAGGKLNYLRIRGIRPEEEYRDAVRRSVQESRQRRQERIEQEKADGTYIEKEAARAKVREQKIAAEREFVLAVADALGWDDVRGGMLKDSESGGDAKKAHAELLRRAKDAVRAHIMTLAADAQYRAAAGLGEIPLVSENGGLSAVDLDDARIRQEKVNHAFRARAAANEEQERKPLDLTRPVEPQVAGSSLTESAKSLADGLKPSIVEAGKVKGLLAAYQKFKATQKAAKAAMSSIDDGEHVEESGYVLKVTEPTREELKRAVADEVRTAMASRFMGAAAEHDPESLHPHVFAGAHAALEDVTQIAVGDALIDRSVVDVLGVAAAAQVVAHGLHRELGEKKAAILAQALGAYHAEHQVRLAKDALEEARKLQDEAAGLMSESADDAKDFALALEIARRRREMLHAARRTIGAALGQLEATAALVQALEEGSRDHLDVSMQDTPAKSANIQLRALGLQPDDYEFEHVGGNLIVRIKRSGMDRLARSADPVEMARIRRNAAIESGKYDEPDWLPEGFARRVTVERPEPGVQEPIAEPLDYAAPDLDAALRRHIGSRLLDGETPESVLGSLYSDESLARGGERYHAALSSVVPSESLDAVRARFEQYADEYAKERFGATATSINRQTFAPDQTAAEALHRALSEEPTAVLAYRPIGDLKRSERAAVAKWLQERIGKPWSDYVEAHGGDVLSALATAQDALRGELAGRFAAYYNAAKAKDRSTSSGGDHGHVQTSADMFGNFLRVGRTLLPGAVEHAMAVDPRQGESLRRHLDSLKKTAGKLLDTASLQYLATREDGEPGPGERLTIGHAAEATLAGMMQQVGRNFVPGQPVTIFQPDMSGPDGVKRQRAIKFILANRRVILAAGTGSGKTGIGLGAFAHLKRQGKAKKGIFIVPSVVQGQFNAEALRFLEPGAFHWHARPGATYHERLSAYKDAGTDFVVATHQSFRDDLLRMASDAGYGSAEEVARKIGAIGKEDRAKFIRDVLAHHGVSFDYVMADEAHNLLDREGKEDSLLSNIVEGVTDNTPYYVHASADVAKNDVSEVYSLLSKMDGQRYRDRDAFMRRFGASADVAKDALRREAARYLFTASVNPDVKVTRGERQVRLNAAQKQAISRVDRLAARLRLARMRGESDVAAAKELSPELFSGAPESAHADIARRVAQSVGIMRSSAVRRVIDAHPNSAKLDHVVAIAGERKGRRGVVFARSLDAVQHIADRLKASGLRVVTLTGHDSSKDKAEKIRAFSPDGGGDGADAIVCSDAGATGANLQAGSWLVQYDTPDTATTHAQRQGRINRIGQKNDIELIDLVADHPAERIARDRLRRKYGLREALSSPLESLDDRGLAHQLEQAGFFNEEAMHHG